MRMMLGWVMLLAGVAYGQTTKPVKDATPAIWRVQGAHETVYLFGTVHVLKPEMHWETGKVAEAFAKSNALYLELAKVDDVAAAQPLVMQLGMDPEHPLSTKITKEDVGLLDAAAKGHGDAGRAAV